jgi:predicted RNA binding protein YcfA (HicA-like mRNA interferase family)
LGRLAGHKPRAVIRAFRSFGWEQERVSGSHCILRKDGNPNVLSIPHHARRDVSEGLLRDQLRAAGIDVDEFLKAL